jgi:16S rRNA (adenine1518-N6/adenine1519-N6)-dimethyltransferase
MIQPKKSLGQNFLRDPNTVRKIVGSLEADAETPVVEIGPGTGALTGLLLERFERVTALEVDERAVALLRETYPALDVRHQDVLETGWAALAEEAGAKLSVVGNLPYYITSPILFGLLDARAHLSEAVVMMQLEVAERLVAEPRSKAYGAPSVLVQLLSTPRLLFKVSRNVFFPKPAVTSAVVRLEFDAEATARRLGGVDVELVRALVRSAFGQRRKTLRNSLGAWTRERGMSLPEGFAARRAESLTSDEFVALAQHVAAQQ